jgi:hypothetical protein
VAENFDHWAEVMQQSANILLIKDEGDWTDTNEGPLVSTLPAAVMGSIAFGENLWEYWAVPPLIEFYGAWNSFSIASSTGANSVWFWNCSDWFTAGQKGVLWGNMMFGGAGLVNELVPSGGSGNNGRCGQSLDAQTYGGGLWPYYIDKCTLVNIHTVGDLTTGMDIWLSGELFGETSHWVWDPKHPSNLFQQSSARGKVDKTFTLTQPFLGPQPLRAFADIGSYSPNKSLVIPFGI